MDLEEYELKRRCQELVDGETRARSPMVHGESIDEVRVMWFVPRGK